MRFLRFSDVWAYPVLLCVGGLGLEGMKEGLKGWIGVESAGCAFCDGTRVFVFFFDPVLTKKLNYNMYPDSRAVIMVTTKTTKGKAVAKSTCNFFFCI